MSDDKPAPSVGHVSFAAPPPAGDTFGPFGPLHAPPAPRLVDPDQLAQSLALQLAEAVARTFEADPHQFSTRPCPSCRAIAGLLGRDFGCNAMAAKRGRR